MNSSPDAGTRSIWRSLLILLAARTILDTGYRAVYPFLPFIATGLGVPLASAAIIIQLRNLTGFTSPLFGPFGDRYGRRVMMVAGMSIVAVMGIAVYFATSLWLATLIIVLMGFGSILYVPAQQAFLGDNVPYQGRGRVMAIAEFSWSLAAIVGLPLVGIIVETRGWQSGFIAVGIAAIFAALLIWFGLPREKRTIHAASAAVGGSYAQALRAPMALAAILTVALMAVANENINLVFGEWMNTSFGLDAVGLGLVAAAIGGAEFFSQLTVALFVDRLGKWRMVGGGLILGAIAYILLPFAGISSTLATAGLVFAYFMFELTIVAAIPLMSELAPQARATLLSMGVAGFALGRTVGSFAGPTLYENFGFTVTSFFSAAAIVVACFVWLTFVREKHPEPAPA